MAEITGAKLRGVKRQRVKTERSKADDVRPRRAVAKPRAKQADKKVDKKADKKAGKKARAVPRAGASTRAASQPTAKAKRRKLDAPKPAPPAAARRRGLPKPRPAEAAPEQPAARARRRPARRGVVPTTAPIVGANDADGLELTEEERIESSKYDVRERERPRRVFEEERFLFPETYQADRVRLLVKDPEWLFAHWDVSPDSMQRLRDDLGERAMALSRLTLKVEDPGDSALSVVLLPEGARSWYLRTHAAHRAYRAQLGLTMPSGEFRALASSNVVLAPRGGPSPARARRRVAFARADAERALAELGAVAAAASQSGYAAADAAASQAEDAGVVDYIDAATGSRASSPGAAERGEASGELGPGGASDTFRR